MPVLTSISPSSGPPGTALTLNGTGFTAGSQAACPDLVATTYVSATQLTAAMDPDLAGPAGGSMALAVFVQNPDGTVSASLPFTVAFPAATLQTWTSIESVTGEVPGFARGGQIGDSQIQTWIESIAQQIAGVMLRRGLPLDPALWQQPSTNAWPTPAGFLEMVNRMGAAARLAAAVSSLFASGDMAITKNLQSAFSGEMAALLRGDYDKLFLPAAATLAPGRLFGSGDTSGRGGRDERAFRKDQKF
jgi:IPT/TIG domain